MSRYALVQYLFKDEEHEVENLLPHGNSKKKNSYRRTFKSTRLALEASVNSKERTPKEILDNVYHSVGDVTILLLFESAEFILTFLLFSQVTTNYRILSVFVPIQRNSVFLVWIQRSTFFRKTSVWPSWRTEILSYTTAWQKSLQFLSVLFSCTNGKLEDLLKICKLVGYGMPRSRWTHCLRYRWREGLDWRIKAKFPVCVILKVLYSLQRQCKKRTGTTRIFRWCEKSYCQRDLWKTRRTSQIRRVGR